MPEDKVCLPYWFHFLFKDCLVIKMPSDKYLFFSRTPVGQVNEVDLYLSKLLSFLKSVLPAVFMELSVMLWLLYALEFAFSVGTVIRILMKIVF